RVRAEAFHAALRARPFVALRLMRAHHAATHGDRGLVAADVERFIRRRALPAEHLGETQPAVVAYDPEACGEGGVDDQSDHDDEARERGGGVDTNSAHNSLLCHECTNDPRPSRVHPFDAY